MASCLWEGIRCVLRVILAYRFAALPLRGLLGNSWGYSERKAPGLFTEGFYKYSVLSASLAISNHHLKNLLLAQHFIFCLREIALSLYAFSLYQHSLVSKGHIALALTLSLWLCCLLYPL